MTWNEKFTDLFERCLNRYQGGDKDFTGYYSEADSAFLESIGYRPREFFDFVEDLCDEGEPAASTALLVAAVRRDYFLVEMDGEFSETSITRDNIPTFGEDFDGIAYLPRILTKARAKLRGELDPDLMFCCGGDRKFLRENGNIHPADFLRQVWAAGEDDQKVADWIRSLA